MLLYYYITYIIILYILLLYYIYIYYITIYYTYNINEQNTPFQNEYVNLKFFMLSTCF